MLLQQQLAVHAHACFNAFSVGRGEHLASMHYNHFRLHPVHEARFERSSVQGFQLSMACSTLMHDIKLWGQCLLWPANGGWTLAADLPVRAAQEHRLHKAEYAALQYAKRDAVPALAGTDAFSERAYASAYDKRAANVRSDFVSKGF